MCPKFLNWCFGIPILFLVMPKHFNLDMVQKVKLSSGTLFWVQSKKFWRSQNELDFQNVEFWSLGHKVQVKAKLKLMFSEATKKFKKSIPYFLTPVAVVVHASKNIEDIFFKFVSFSKKQQLYYNLKHDSKC